ncbi:hypothetical protein DYBT9275_02112 [Dyadobacter sp. CECT 9275]|uniref:Uncharacterized protein n=1 Tax=Dyadobacter helix TaxID=2822344 RepID=A0A916JA93_9BACT|nr:hypothetical protein [Dyadobacter sp. CECT 9275]CAG4998936.1 hypothetical protein DYBT9275_02112 [Dyadobacter sp. CECT 9275]
MAKPRHYNFDKPEIEAELVEIKIQELIDILQNARLDAQRSVVYQQRISDAFQKSANLQGKIKPFQELDKENNLSREELLEGLEKLLNENPIDTEISRSYLRKQTLQKVIICLFSVVLVATGFAMIIMPAPVSFELFTVFYFNNNDGVTIMDLVSLLIILGGVFLFVINFNKK